MPLSLGNAYRPARCGALALVLFLAACGDSGDRTANGPLPSDPSYPRAFSERFLAENPHAALRPEHLALLRLEATAADARDADTGVAGGVDEVLYHFEHDTELTLEIDTDAHHIGQLVLSDLDGTTWAEADLDAPVVAVALPAGQYVLEVRHARRGDTTAPTRPVFLHPAATAGSTLAVGSAAGSDNPNVAAILAGQNCVGCDFTGVMLLAQDAWTILDGLDLHDSTFGSVFMGAVGFRGANLDQTRWWAGSCSGCQFPYPALFRVDFTDASMVGATFQSAELAGVQFRGADMRGVDFCFLCDVSGIAASGCPANDSSPTCDAAPPTDEDQGCDFSSDAAGKPTNLSFSNLSMLTLPPCTTFAGATLSNATFTGNRFQTVNFAGAQLDNAIMDAMFPDANFTGAVLDGAHLTNANAGGADFSGASLKHTVMKTAEFQNANFTSAVLDGADLTQANASGANFTSAVLDGANLTQTNASGANFSHASFLSTVMTNGIFAGANLFEADLPMAMLDGAVLVGANLDYANLRGASMVGAMLGVVDAQSDQRASLVGAYMPDVDLTDADLRNANLTGAHLYGDQSLSKLIRVRLDGATLEGAICSGASFDSASLTRTQFNHALLVATTFDDAVLTGALFDSAYLQGADFSTAQTTGGVSLNNAAIATAPGAWTYMEQDGTPVTYSYGATKLGALASDPTVICPDGNDGPCTGTHLTPVMNGPFPPVPPCVPTPPEYDNCVAPTPPPG